MDSSLGQQPQLDISKLSDYEKRELQQTLTNEMQRAKIQDSTSLRAYLTDNSPSFSTHEFPTD